MKVFKNRSNILFFVVSIILISIFNVIFIINVNNRDRMYNQEYYKTISNILDIIADKYPDVNEIDVIDILNSNDSSDSLSFYGIDKNEAIVNSLNDIKKESNIVLIVMLIIFDLLFIVIIIVYLSNRKNKYDDVLKSIKKINNKIYDLDIDDNSEDEVSVLKNELHKTTLMLKQQYEMELTSRKSLQLNIEDVSHQLKTPLATISILLDNIIDSKKMDEETTRSFLIDIRKQVYLMNELIVVLLKSCRLDSGVVEFKQENINVSELFKSINDNLSMLLDLKNISLNIDINKNITIVGDKIWETEALTNIVKNAIEYSKEDTIININVIKNSVYTKLTITDSGSGMSEQETKKIFDRFYKNNESTTSFGIGLNLAKTIIEKDNGYINVKSKIGEGTTFIIKYMNK